MAARKAPTRYRVGRVSYYQHHGAWYLYFRDAQGVQRPRVGRSQAEAERAAALKNAELTAGEVSTWSPLGTPSAVLGRADVDRPALGVDVEALLRGFLDLARGQAPGLVIPSVALPGVPAPDSASAMTVIALRQEFLDHHEHVVASSLPTVQRYAAATNHLVRFAEQEGVQAATEISASKFARHLRNLEVAPNGHRHAARRPLSEKSIGFTLQTCGSMYRFGVAHNLLPKGWENPFKVPGLRKLGMRRAKPIYVFDPAAELKFFRASDAWSFAVHFVLAKTGLRPGELAHTLIDDLALESGWLRVTAKLELGWNVKTDSDRSVPLAPEVAHVLRQVIGDRQAGPVFQRVQITPAHPASLAGDRAALARVAQQRLTQRRQELGRKLTRGEEATVHRGIWRDVGAVDPDRIRSAFIAVAKESGISATCPKSWRHTFATLLQEANVDPLIRQITLGHQPARPEQGALGMTSLYTHTRPEVQQREILRALRLRAESLVLGGLFRIP